MSKYKDYLCDLGFEIKRRALEARQERCSTAEGSLERAFEAGRVMALNEVIAIMQQQASAFGIELSEIRLSGYNPDQIVPSVVSEGPSGTESGEEEA